MFALLVSFNPSHPYHHPAADAACACHAPHHRRRLARLAGQVNNNNKQQCQPNTLLHPLLLPPVAPSAGQFTLSKTSTALHSTTRLLLRPGITATPPTFPHHRRPANGPSTTEATGAHRAARPLAHSDASLPPAHCCNPLPPIHHLLRHHRPPPSATCRAPLRLSAPTPFLRTAAGTVIATSPSPPPPPLPSRHPRGSSPARRRSRYRLALETSRRKHPNTSHHRRRTVATVGTEQEQTATFLHGTAWVSNPCIHQQCDLHLCTRATTANTVPPATDIAANTTIRPRQTRNRDRFNTHEAGCAPLERRQRRRPHPPRRRH